MRLDKFPTFFLLSPQIFLTIRSSESVAYRILSNLPLHNIPWFCRNIFLEALCFEIKGALSEKEKVIESRNRIKCKIAKTKWKMGGHVEEE